MDMSEQHKTHFRSEPNILFDVFITYNTKDKEHVFKVVEALNNRYGINCYTDKLFPPGQDAMVAMQKGVHQSKAIAIFIGTHGAGKWQGMYEQMLAIIQTINRPLPLIPVLLPGVNSIDEISWEEDGFLDYLKTRTVVQFTKIDSAEALHNLARGILGHEPIPIPNGKPYGILVKVPEAEASCFLAMPKQGLSEIYNSIIQAAQEAEVQIFQTRDQVDRCSRYVSDIQGVIQKIRSSAVVIAVSVSKPTNYGTSSRLSSESDRTINNKGFTESRSRPKSLWNRWLGQSQEFTVQCPDSQNRVFDFEPDVLYELGLAHALGKPLLLILDSCSSNFLSNYILKDIDQKNFIEYDSTTTNQEQLKLKLKERLIAVKQDAKFPKIEGLTDDIQVIQDRNYICILPEFWKNFHNILGFGIGISHRFAEIQTCLTHLYHEIEQVMTIQRKEIQNKDLEQEINDIKVAWKAYQDCHQKMLKDFADNFTDSYYQDLEASFDFFSKNVTQQLDKTARDNYNKIKTFMMLEYGPIRYERIEKEIANQNFAHPSLIQYLESDVGIALQAIECSLIKQCHSLVLSVVELIPHEQGG